MRGAATMLFALVCGTGPAFADFVPGQAADRVLGQAGFQTKSAPVPPTAASMRGPYGVADTANDRVLCFKNAASLANGADADGVLGQRDFIVRETLGGRRGIRSPRGLAVDAAGRLFASSQGLNRVVRLDRANGAPNFAAWTGVLGQPTFSETVGLTKKRKLHQPIGVALESAKRLWVVDFQNVRAVRYRAQ